MSQKLTLARYLEGRGSVKSLTRIEAEAFGVPYPLVSGWPARHGDMEVTQVMLEDLSRRIALARRSTAIKASRAVANIGIGQVKISTSPASALTFDLSMMPRIVSIPSKTPNAITDFIRRRAKRYRNAAHITATSYNNRARIKQ